MIWLSIWINNYYLFILLTYYILLYIIMNKKKGGFIKDLQNYQKSISAIQTKNNQFTKKEVPSIPIKTNNQFTKQDGVSIKTNNQFTKTNGVSIKTNNQFTKQDGVSIKTNNQFTKTNGVSIKTNNQFTKTNGVSIKNAQFGKLDGVGVKNAQFGKLDGVGVKGDNQFGKLDGVGLKGDNQFGKLDGVGVKGDNKFGKLDGVGVKGDNKFGKLDGVGVKGDNKFGKLDGVSIKNAQFGKLDGVGVKGDMDGLGKEKGNYTPKFVYLYKNKFEMEAIKNKYDMKGLSPLSGYEPKYNPYYWNNNKNIKNNNNCYSYSVNNKNHHFGKPQPGYFARFNHIQNNQYKCAYFFKRILNDIPSVYLTSFKQKCKKGFHKAFFAIDSNKNEHDYHFYRQDNNQLWSHKPGTTNVINYDADYKIIKNPYSANRNYTSYNYDKPCFFFCVNNKFGKTKAKI